MGSNVRMIREIIKEALIVILLCMNAYGITNINGTPITEWSHSRQSVNYSTNSSYSMKLNSSQLTIIQEQETSFEITLLNSSTPITNVSGADITIALKLHAPSNPNPVLQYLDIPAGHISRINESSWLVTLTPSFTLSLRLDYTELIIYISSELYQINISETVPVEVISPDMEDPTITITLMNNSQVVSANTTYIVEVTDDFFIRSVLIQEDNGQWGGTFGIEYSGSINKPDLTYTRYYFRTVLHFTNHNYYGDGNISVAVIDGDFDSVTEVLSFIEDTKGPEIEFDNSYFMGKTTIYDETIHLKWTAADESGIQCFKIYRAHPTAEDELLKTVDGSLRETTITLTEEGWYTISVVAYDIYGNHNEDTITFYYSTTKSSEANGDFTALLSAFLIISLYVGFRISYPKSKKRKNREKH